MKWGEFYRLVADQPVFSSAILLAGEVSAGDVRRQLSRWVRNGKVILLRRGIYTLAPPYRKIDPHPFLIANALKGSSYISLQSSLAYYGLIPEHTPLVTSITAGRPERIETALGTFSFFHVRKTWFAGYKRAEVKGGQWVFLAGPEKSLLDLVYLTARADGREYLRELRLQNLDRLDREELARLARESGSPKLIRAAERISLLQEEE